MGKPTTATKAPPPPLPASLSQADVDEPPNKKVKTVEQRAVNDAGTFLRRVVNGKVANVTPQMQIEAQAGLDMLKTCTKTGKVEFAQRVEQSKASKNFAWVRDFKETMETKKTTYEGVHENYYTRIVKTCFLVPRCFIYMGAEAH
jgi:hypothetical protein